MEKKNGPAEPELDETPTDGARGSAEPTPPSGADSEATPSATAVGAAAHRAAHLIIDGSPPILDDPVSIRLLDPHVRAAIEAGAGRFKGHGSLGLRCSIVVRSRFAEDRLAESVRRDDIRQFVLLGAGLDTFACRQPGWAGQARIFEVDLPASQADKRRRLARAGIAEPPNVTYVAADLAVGDFPDRLAGAGFDLGRPTFVACLGVLVYLDEVTVFRVFDAVSKFAAGTRFVFSFSRAEVGAGWPSGPGSPALPALPARPRGGAAERAAALGEPWQSPLDPIRVEDHLRRHGFRAVTFAFPDDVAREYLAGRTDGLFQPPRAVLADAIL